MESLWLDTHRLSPSTDALTEGAHYDTVVAGAGLTGLTTAVLLARAGHHVAVLEARFVGAVTTGNTTGKLSLLQGTVLSQIRHFHSDKVLRAYVDGNLEGQAWLTRFMRDRDVSIQRRTACTYATTPDGAAAVARELEAARIAGLSVEQADETELPFEVTAAITLPDQAQFQPMEVLGALADELRERGGVLVEDARLTDAKNADSRVRVETSRGHITAERLVLATGFPVLDRGAYFAKMTPLRSYVAAFRVPDATTIPQGMYLSADDPTRSLRTAATGDDELLLVGGNGHVVGRSDSEQAAVEDLDAWTRKHFPGAERTHAWSAQDYQSINRVPFVGRMPRGGGNIWMATGYNKWGLTNAVAAGLSLTTQILGGSMEWADVLGHRVTKPAALASTAQLLGGVGAHMVKDWVQAEVHGLPGGDPAEGDGVVGRLGATPVARSTVNGKTCQVSGVCTHMGGILKWNDAEKSWDCPLHGSRFAPDGQVLEGPATKDLPGVTSKNSD